jgi:hypothetical protein
VTSHSQPGFRSGRQAKDALYRETLQTTGRTTRIFNRPKRVCVDHPSVHSATRTETRRERAHYPSSRGPSSLRFSGMAESFGPMWSKPGAGVPPPVGRSPEPSPKGRDGRNAPYPSSAMSSGRLFLIGLLASRARLRFTGTRRLTCTPRMLGQKGTFLLCSEGDISTLR